MRAIPALSVIAALTLAPAGAKGDPPARPRKVSGQPGQPPRATRPARPHLAAKATPAPRARRAAARAALPNGARRQPSRSFPGRAPAGGNVAPAGRTPAERALQHHLEAVLGSPALKAALNGVHVVDVATGDVLFSYGPDRQLNPASNVKLVSTATALAVLGPDYRFKTVLLGPAPDEEGTVTGDVHLHGSADPTLATAHLVQLADAVAEGGVRRITGDLVFTDGARDAVASPRVVVTVTGGGEDGELPRVQVEPELPFFVVDTTAVTSRRIPTRRVGRRQVPVGVDVALRLVADDPRGEHVRITVSGKIAPGAEVKVKRVSPRAALFTAHAVRAALLTKGVTVEGGVRAASDEPDSGWVVLGENASMDLPALAARINKPSNNVLADRLLLHVAATRYGGEGTFDKGVRAMAEWLADAGVPLGSYRLDNGSGLSYTNHLSARQVVQVLLAAARGTFSRAFVDSLSIAGLDGTLRRRFAGRPSTGAFLGKTGTLTGVAALSGFVKSDSIDDGVCFSILTSDFANRRKLAVRAAQADIVDALHAFVRSRPRPAGQRDPAAPATPAAPAGAPGVDTEDSEEGDDLDEVDDAGQEPGIVSGGDDDDDSAAQPAAAPAAPDAPSGAPRSESQDLLDAPLPRSQDLLDAPAPVAGPPRL